METNTEKLIQKTRSLSKGAIFALLALVAIVAGAPDAMAQAFTWDGTALAFDTADAADDLYTIVVPIAAAGIGIYLFKVGVAWLYNQLRKVGRG